MIRIFFLLAIRNFLKNRMFVIINILGLGIALSCCIVAYLNYRFEADYNTMHINCNNIYKINVKQRINDQLQNYSISPMPLGPVMTSEIAGIDRMVRYTRSYLPIRYKEDDKEAKIFIEKIGFADKDFFRMFTFPMKWGDSTAFEDQSKILLSEKTAEKFFGKQSPVGKRVTVFNESGKGTELIVGGVYKEIPYNSIVRFEAVTLYANYLSMYELNEFDWKNWTAATFIQVSNHNQIRKIEDFLVKYIDIQNKKIEGQKIEKFDIQSLYDFTKNSHNLKSNWVGTDLHPALTITLIVMALLILFLTCFNYINTSIAISNKRLKEIGIRKVVGSSRIGLIIQFIGENFLICTVALIFSFLIASYLIDEYNKMVTFEMIHKDYISNAGVWMFLAITLIFTTLLSSVFPAFYVSSFNPVKVLKGTIKFSGIGVFSRILLVLQFSISLIGLVSSIVFAQNAHFQKSFDFGYNKDQIITIPVGSSSNLEMLSKAIEKNPNVLKIVATNDHIPLNSTTRTAKYIDQRSEIRLLNTYSSYCTFMDLKILQGREFTPEFETTDLNRSAIVNESLVKVFKWDNPIGKIIKIDTLSMVVVGVVKDFYDNLYDPIMPIVMRMVPKDQLNTLLVKGDKNKLTFLNKQIKEDWERLIPYAPYEGVIQDENYEYAQTDNKSIQKVFNFLSIVAISLSLIALYTLISLNIIKRTKEIGIRKVLGAPFNRINFVIIRPFLLILVIASFIGGYGGFFLSKMLLNSVWIHHINVNAISVFIPIVVLLVVAFFIMFSKIHYVFCKNPVNALKYE